MKYAILILVCALAVPLAKAQDSADLVRIEELMSAKDFRAAGLHKLSNKELQHLNSWLLKY